MLIVSSNAEWSSSKGIRSIIPDDSEQSLAVCTRPTLLYSSYAAPIIYNIVEWTQRIHYTHNTCLIVLSVMCKREYCPKESALGFEPDESS